MSKPQKYAHINFKCPKSVAENAEKGLTLRRDFGRGGTEIGVARARDLKNRKGLSPKTIERMTQYFARHETDKNAEHFGNDENPSAGYVAWLLWGGDAGRRWTEEIKSKMAKADR